MPEAPLVTQVDHALPPALLRDALAALDAVGTKASYWRTFWFPLEKPENALERAILSLLSHVGEPGLVGTEWWIGRMDTRRVPLDFHHDRDLALFDQEGRLSFPTWSSVLYLSTPVGGQLAVTDQRLVRRADALVLSPREPRRFESVRPVTNRFVRFDGRFLHGVLDATGSVPTKPLRAIQGETLRLSLVVNWWKRRPLGLKRWSETRAYPALRDR